MSTANSARVPNRSWLAGGALGTAAAIAVTGVAAWSWAADPGTQTEDQDQTYQHQVNRIELNLAAGHISLAAGDPGQVAVRRHLQWKSSRPVVHEDWTGDTLRITADCPKEQNHCAVDYTVRVPAGVAVQAQTGAGDLAARDLAGELRLTTGAGRTVVDHTTGPLRVRSGEGDVTGTALRAAETDIDTEAGQLTLQYDAAPTTVRANTVDGNVEITLPQSGDTAADAYRVSADTKDGNRTVIVRQDSDSRRSVTATTTSGDVAVSYG